MALSLVGGGDPETYNLMEKSVDELYNHVGVSHVVPKRFCLVFHFSLHLPFS